MFGALPNQFCEFRQRGLVVGLEQLHRGVVSRQQRQAAQVAEENMPAITDRFGRSAQEVQ